MVAFRIGALESYNTSRYTHQFVRFPARRGRALKTIQPIHTSKSIYTSLLDGSSLSVSVTALLFLMV